MDIRRTLAAVAALALMSAPVSAALIVDFSGDAAGTDGTTGNMGVTSTAGGNFTSTLAFADNAGNGLTRAGFPKLTIASRYFVANATNGAGRSLGYRTTESPDRFRLTYAPSTTGDRAVDFDFLGLVYKQDFAALTTETVKFDSTSFMSMGNPTVTASATVKMNFVVKNDGVFYMSTTQYTTQGAKSLTDLPSQNWIVFDPTANDGDLSGLTSVSGGGQTYTFENVQAVGLYVEGRSSETANALVDWNNWKVDAVAVPEPGSIAVLGAAVAVGLLGRRKLA